MGGQTPHAANQPAWRSRRWRCARRQSRAIQDRPGSRTTTVCVDGAESRWGRIRWGPMGPNPMGPNPMGPNPMGPNPMGPNPMGKDPVSAEDPRAASDAQLVVAIGRFHQAALAEAYRRHAGATFGLALRILNTRVLAEDVVQEVFLRLWNEPEKFDSERGSLRAFLLAQTHGRSVDLVRDLVRAESVARPVLRCARGAGCAAGDSRLPVAHRSGGSAGGVGPDRRGAGGGAPAARAAAAPAADRTPLHRGARRRERRRRGDHRGRALRADGAPGRPARSSNAQHGARRYAPRRDRGDGRSARTHAVPRVDRRRSGNARDHARR